MFDEKTQIDVFTILLLLGEAAIWNALWCRFRTTRLHWRQWIFAVSPGWAPIAMTVFAKLNVSDGPPNLIFDMPPEGEVEQDLQLTHLSSGATHPATHVVLQNIWHTWVRGPRKSHRKAFQHDGSWTFKETGLIDIDFDALQLHNNVGLGGQLIALILQFVLAGTLGLLPAFTYEPLIALAVAFTGQLLLVSAVTPREEAWTHPKMSSTIECPVMLHKGLESSSVLIIRKCHRAPGVSPDNNFVNLESFCSENAAPRKTEDTLKLICAGLSCLALMLHILLVGWMTTMNKILYFIVGCIGLAANITEGASRLNWLQASQTAFTGVPICSPDRSGIMAAVAVLVAGNFLASEQAGNLLFPNNDIFKKTYTELDSMVSNALCDLCRSKINPLRARGQNSYLAYADTCTGQPKSCVEKLGEELDRTPEVRANSQRRDAICTIYNGIRDYAPGSASHMPKRLTSLHIGDDNNPSTMTLWGPAASQLYNAVTGPLPSRQ